MKVLDKPVEILNREVFFETLGYKPFPKEEYLHTLYEWYTILLAGGVRFSKSYWTSMEASYRIYTRLMEQLRNGEDTQEYYWLVGSDYKQTKPEWGYMAKIFRQLGLYNRKHSSQKFLGDSGKASVMAIGFSDWPAEKCALIETKTADNLDKIAGFPLMGYVVCEAAQCVEDVYWKGRERLAQNRSNGSWMILEGTFEGSLGWYPRCFEKWEYGNAKENAVSVSCPSWENTIIFPGGENDPAILEEKAMRSEEDFMERFGGRPCPPKGGVMSGSWNYDINVNTEMATYDPEDDVYLAHDPGIVHAASALAIQLRSVPGMDQPVVCVIDEVYTNALQCADFIEVVMKRKWWPNVHKTKSVIDQAGGFRDFRGDPVVKQWKDKTCIQFAHNKVPVNKARNMETGVDLLKRFVKPHFVTGKPNIYIHPNCTGLISEWGGCLNPITGDQKVWKWQIDAQGNHIRLGKVNDDSSKALIYFIWHHFGYSEKRAHKNTNKPIIRTGGSNANI